MVPWTSKKKLTEMSFVNPEIKPPKPVCNFRMIYYGVLESTVVLQLLFRITTVRSETYYSDYVVFDILTDWGKYKHRLIMGCVFDCLKTVIVCSSGLSVTVTKLPGVTFRNTKHLNVILYLFRIKMLVYTYKGVSNIYKRTENLFHWNTSSL
jgi:hypothetical protein